jgi:hypothetical protein
MVLREHELLSSHLISHDIMTDTLGPRSAICLPLKYLPLWLAGIQAKRVHPDIRARLLVYQEECVEVLARYFLGDGVAVNPQEVVTRSARKTGL